MKLNSPLFLLTLFIFGTSRLLLAIPMEGDSLLSVQKSNRLAEERAQREYESSRQDELDEDTNSGMESSTLSRGIFSHIAELPKTTQPASVDAHAAIELSQSPGSLGSHKIIPFKSNLKPATDATGPESERDPLLKRAGSAPGYGSDIGHGVTVADSEIRKLPLAASKEAEETEPDCWSGIRNCFASLFGSTTPKKDFLTENRGIHNTQDDCYMNSALQCLKTVFLQCSDTQQANALEELKDQLHLVSFLKGNLDASIEKNGRNLRKDVAALVSSDRGLDELDRNNIDKTGSSLRQADPIDFLRVFLPHLDKSTMRQEVRTRSCVIPGLQRTEAERLATLIKKNQGTSLPSNPDSLHPVVIEFQHEREGETATEGAIVDLHLSQSFVYKEKFPTLDCDLEEDRPVSDMQSLVREKIVETRRGFFDETIEQIFYKEPCYLAMKQGGQVPPAEDVYQDILIEEKIGNPPPSSLVITIKRLHADYTTDPPTKKKIETPINDIWEPVVLPGDQEGRDFEYTYVPTSIICHLGVATGGHYISYRKNGGDWYKFNDAHVEKINLDDRLYTNYSHKDLIMKNASVVSYQLVGARPKVQVEMAATEAQHGVSATTVSVAVSAASGEAVAEDESEDGF